jgi:hypothetical protein
LLALWGALLLAFWATTACQGGGQTSGESHFGKTKAFLRICEDGSCGSGDDCVCAVCTVPCAGVEECRRRISGDANDATLPDTIVCRAPFCGDAVNDEATPDVGSVCDVECTEDADCAFLDQDQPESPHFCNAGYCRTLAEPEGPVEVSGDPQAVCPTGMQLLPGSALPGGIGLCLDVTEVTVAAYRTCVEAAECTAPEAGNFLTAGRELHPIHFVSELEAEAYCAFRGGRLPRFEEWQVAASRGGEPGAFPWGTEPPAATDDPPRVCGLGATTTCEGGAFPAGDNTYGHTDLLGNVAEWVVTADGHCLAGGHFESAAEELTTTTCGPAVPADGHTGIRCVRDL